MLCCTEYIAQRLWASMAPRSPWRYGAVSQISSTPEASRWGHSVHCALCVCAKSRVSTALAGLGSPHFALRPIQTGQIPSMNLDNGRDFQRDSDGTRHRPSATETASPTNWVAVHVRLGSSLRGHWLGLAWPCCCALLSQQISVLMYHFMGILVNKCCNRVRLLLGWFVPACRAPHIYAICKNTNECRTDGLLRILFTQTRLPAQ